VLVQISNHGRTINAAIRNGFSFAGDEIVKEMKRLITTGSKTGRMYGSHQASAPGESPANKTGKLAESGNYKLRGSRQMEVGEEADYAIFLELGTKRMRPRPHVMAAINNKAGDMLVEFERLGI
jgi:HK97 gp10 family phage protein